MLNLKKTALLFLLFDILLIVIIAAITYCTTKEAAVYTTSYHNGKLFHPDGAENGADTDYETSHKDCGVNEMELEDFVTNSVESWYKQYRNKDRPCTHQPDISVTLKPNIKLVGYTNFVQGKTEKVVRWDGNSDMSFNHKRHYADGYITVPTTGLYRIYSHVTFRIDNNGKLHTLSHAILAQRSNGKDVRLVNNVMPSCGTTAGEMKVPSFLESVVQLKRGDRLYVEVHAVGEIMAGQENNFFGAFML